MFQMDPLLQDIELQGEISNVKLHQTGMLFFTMKDEQASIACVMSSADGLNLQVKPFDGMRVIAHGNASLFARGGQYQFYVKDLRAQGLGVLYERYEKLKAQLQREGLFSIENKRPIPEFVDTIGVVSSPTGAVIHDIIRVASYRDSKARILLCPAKVQGTGAAEEIIAAMSLLEEIDEVSVIVLARGGGSIEDLWAFNEEKLVRAVAGCSKPVVSAVGHETDFTLCDFAADLRAPTPSSAAELVTFRRVERERQLEDLKNRLDDVVYSRLNHECARMASLKERMNLLHPSRRIDVDVVCVNDLKKQLLREMNLRFSREDERIVRFRETLEILNPFSVLKRGYAIVSCHGEVVRDASALNVGDRVSLRLARGVVQAEIMDASAEKPGEEA